MKISLQQILILTIVIVLANNYALAAEEYFPLVVFGGEPEGVMAAITAAREGVETLLIMEREKPGGLMTYGGLNYLDINHAPDGSNLNRGLFNEWHRLVGGNISFSIKRATEVFQEMLEAEENLTVYNSAELVSVIREGQLLKGLIIRRGEKQIIIRTERIIDSNQDADLTAMAGVPWFKGGADNGLPDRQMAVTLVLHMGNIDWSRLAKDVRTNRYGPSHINRDHAWGFVKIGQLYQPRNPNIKLRGLNIVLEGDGDKKEVYINSMLIFNTNPLEQESLQQAYQWGQEEAKHVLSFLQENLGGFEKATLLSSPPELYIRESRHILTEYQLGVADLLENRIFNDTIALASYPLDYQASNPIYNGFVVFNPVIYGIPMRSLIPLGIDNLLLVGRSTGFSSLAAASSRVLPTGMTAAEAAGIATAISLDEKVSYREMIEKQEYFSLIQKKIKIDKTIDKFKDKLYPLVNDQDVLPALKDLLSWGLIIAGYDNEFNLHATISEREFAHIIVKGLQRKEAPILYEWVPGGLETMSKNKDLSRNQAAMLLLVAISKRVSELSPEEYYPNAITFNLIPSFIQETVKEDRLLTRKEAYIILAEFFKQYHLPTKLLLYRGEY